MKVVGLTGSMGMGKSTVSGMIRNLSIPLWDADASVHATYGDPAFLKALQGAFPRLMTLDRPGVAAALVDDPGRLNDVVDLLRPYVLAQRDAFLAAHAAADLVVLDIPLLFENGLETTVDVVVVVDCSEELQRARVMARPGMTAEKFALLAARQMPNAEKLARADFIIPTGTSLDNTRAAVERMVAELLT